MKQILIRSRFCFLFRSKRGEISTHLAALSHVLFHSFKLEMKVIVMGFVFLSDFVSKQIEFFTVLDGESRPLGDPFFNLSQERMSVEWISASMD